MRQQRLIDLKQMSIAHAVYNVLNVLRKARCFPVGRELAQIYIWFLLQ